MAGMLGVGLITAFLGTAFLGTAFLFLLPQLQALGIYHGARVTWLDLKGVIHPDVTLPALTGTFGVSLITAFLFLGKDFPGAVCML